MGFFNRNRNQELLALDSALNQRIQEGKALEALEEFYSDDVIMQENDSPPTVGKAANREREQAFFAAISELRQASVIAQGAGDNVTFSHWDMDFTHREWGVRTFRQVAVRTWKNGKIVREVFHYG